MLEETKNIYIYIRRLSSRPKKDQESKRGALLFVRCVVLVFTFFALATRHMMTFGSDDDDDDDDDEFVNRRL